MVLSLHNNLLSNSRFIATNRHGNYITKHNLCQGKTAKSCLFRQWQQKEQCPFGDIAHSFSLFIFHFAFSYMPLATRRTVCKTALKNKTRRHIRSSVQYGRQA
jgi:hypothetical protein